METSELKKTLLEAAICTMACDGEIHEHEIAEIQKISENTSYFNDFDCKTELKKIIDEITTDGHKFVEEYFEKIKSTEIGPAGKLLILEVILRIMHADNRIDENEIKFANLVKSKLGIPDQIINKRFGVIDFLVDDKVDHETLSNIKNTFMAQLKVPLPEKFTNLKTDTLMKSVSDNSK